MTRPRATREAVSAALAPSGLIVRGATILPGDDAPRLASGAAARAVVLIGHGGGAFFSVFEAWREANPDRTDPLDTWSKAVIAPVAAALGGEAVFPSDPPYLPFQRWAMAAEGLRPSPLGILIHPVYGLWHGYRGAILFAGGGFGDPDPSEPAPHPCDACVEKPCLSACPVSAFTPVGYEVAACRAHLTTAAGRGDCIVSGCRARGACPVGAPYRYGVSQMRFHMAAFAPDAAQAVPAASLRD